MTEHRPAWALRTPLPQAATVPSSPTSLPSPTASAGPGFFTDSVADVTAAPRRRPALPLPLGPELGIGLLLAAALALFWLPLRSLGDRELDRMGDLGLVSVLPATTFLGAGLLVLAFASLLRLDRPHRALLTAVLLATLFSLHGLQAASGAASAPSGAVEVLAEFTTGTPADAATLARWWPAAVHLLALGPLLLMMRQVRAGWRAPWTGAWIFVLSSWAVPDGSAAEGIAHLLHLSFVALVLVRIRVPRTTEPEEHERLPGEPPPAEAESSGEGLRPRTAVPAVVVAVFAAALVTDAPTALFMLAVLAGLVLARRSRMYGPLVLLALLTVGWAVFSGEQLRVFRPPAGAPGTEGGSARQLLLPAGVVPAAAVLLLAWCGWWRRHSHGHSERTLLVVALAPATVLLLRPMDEAVAAQMFACALPGTALLAALALFPRAGTATTAGGRERGRTSAAPVGALLAGLTLTGGFLVVHGGDAPFERVTPGEAEAVAYVEGLPGGPGRLLWLSDGSGAGAGPALSPGILRPTAAPRDPVLVGGLVAALREAGPHAYLMAGHRQAEYLRLTAGHSASWERRLVRSLDARPDLVRVLSNDDAPLYALRGTVRVAAHPGPGRDG
ncbi:hypothetical protein ACFW9O_00445 [Streptomyces sp. NPDC059499]|uniref:hypothetical protein n=1 Tax=Streptomyces sp. NPDC059499 TaxID=3346852 RepID=UPI0036AB8796